MMQRPLRFATFLAPSMLPVYGAVTRYVSRKLGCRAELFVGVSYEQLATEADAGFVCGLAYVALARGGMPPIEPLVAPVLQGERYGGRPVYFSDVVVHRDSRFRSFADLRGRSWCYNEPLSHSGYGITRYHLVRLGETQGYFGRVIRAGYHQRSLRLVASGKVDASAIDSQVLAIAARDYPRLVAQLRVIDSFGPSTIQPVVTSRRLPERLRDDLRAVLLEMQEDRAGRQAFARGFIEQFAPVADASYDDIRAMLAAAEAADFLTLR